jgi:hypothetical protein
VKAFTAPFDYCKALLHDWRKGENQVHSHFLPEAQIRDMKDARIQLVVLSRLKGSVQQYVAAANVITFEDFLEDHLDPKMTKWKKHGVISNK